MMCREDYENTTPANRAGQKGVVHGASSGKAKSTLTDARKLENRLKRQGRGKGFYTITGLHRRGS